jgi:hypothetical protein
MEFKDLLPSSQESATEAYAEPDESWSTSSHHVL